VTSPAFSWKFFLNGGFDLGSIADSMPPIQSGDSSQSVFNPSVYLMRARIRLQSKAIRSIWQQFKPVAIAVLPRNPELSKTDFVLQRRHFVAGIRSRPHLSRDGFCFQIIRS
jgi:hypothetical protein